MGGSQETECRKRGIGDGHGLGVYLKIVFFGFGCIEAENYWYFRYSQISVSVWYLNLQIFQKSHFFWLCYTLWRPVQGYLGWGWAVFCDEGTDLLHSC